MEKSIVVSVFNRKSWSINIASALLGCVMLTVNTPLLAVEGFSEVNNALFDSPHMHTIKVPGRLNYQYQKTTINEPLKQDRITVTIKNITDDGRTDQAYGFFTGENRRPYQDRRKQLGNGIFMLFLERDVHELERQTGGSWRHFQRRIRWAMAAGASKKQVPIAYHGKPLTGIQYIIQPYADDAKSTRYGPYKNKYYSFTLSDEIPGTIYQIRSMVPKIETWKEGDEVITDERITFTGFTPDPVN